MFIKLMRKEGLPIWIKAESIVTVEPTRTGGSLVVPLGDGLDYEVCENPETVLALIAGEPLPKIEPPTTQEEAPKKTKRVATRKAKAKAETESEVAVTPTEEKPKKKRATRKAKEEPAPIFFPVDQLDRIRKMAPGSVKKLSNTLVTQFKIEDPDAIVKHLEDSGVIAVVEHGHVNWLPPSADNVLKL